MDPSGTDEVRRERRRTDARIETLVGGALVAAVALGGLYFAIRPESAPLDEWLQRLIGNSNNGVWRAVAATRQPWVVVTGSVILGALTFARDRPRAIALLVGPPAALAACELVAKPLVGRTIGDLSYPSGSTVGAAALACAAVLATPRVWRTVTVVVGGLYSLWTAVAVVALGWHFPTDALAGLALGVGTVLLADGLAWVVDGALGRARAERAASRQRG